MKDIHFVFVLDIDSGLFDQSTFDKMEILHSKNEEEK